MVKYARSVGGNWSADATWSTTSGGAADTTKPTSADNVVLDANSGNVTIDAAAVCRSLDCNDYTGILTHAAGVTLAIGDGTSGTGNRALRFVAGMTYTLGNVHSSAITFTSGNATIQTIDFAGKQTGQLLFTGARSYKYLGAHTTNTGNAASVNLNQATLDLNGQVVSWNSFQSNSGATRQLKGATNLTITAGGSAAWDVGAITGLTIDADTSITFSGLNQTFDTAGKTFAAINFTGTGILTITGAGVIVTLQSTGNKTIKFPASTTVSITNWSAQGTSGNILTLISSTAGTAATISLPAGTVSVDYVSFKDIAVIGGVIFNAGINSVNVSGNSGINFLTLPNGSGGLLGIL